MQNTELMIIAGEISGDMHAASLVKAIRRNHPDVTFFGIGGAEMREAGVETIYDIRDMAVMGLSEVLRRFSFFKRVFYEMVGLAAHRRPAAVILVDYPGFNLRLARKLHFMGIKVIYYICPQVWAWNRSRIPRMARFIDRLITLFPFEAEHFDGTGLDIKFAGHPLVDEAELIWKQPTRELPWKGEPRVALLPGSRIHEIERMLPVMWAAAKLVEDQHVNSSFIIAAPTKEIEKHVLDILQALPKGPSRWAVVTGHTRQVLRQAKAAIVASGTATLETSLMRCPMIVAYKVGRLTYCMAKLLIRISHIAMVNIVAGKEICPELIQHSCTPTSLASALEPLLTDTPERKEMLSNLDEVNKRLGSGGAAANAAQAVMEVIED